MMINRQQLTLFISSLLCLISPMTNAEMKDPTKPPQLAAVVAHNGYTLTAIMTSDNKKLAIINGKVVRIGDEIDNAKVTAINSNTVELDAPSGSLTLTLMVYPIVQEEDTKAH
jgi:hypothetical protein